MSDTPRTDRCVLYDGSFQFCPAEFVRQLERELNTAIANEAIAENTIYILTKQLEELKKTPIKI